MPNYEQHQVIKFTIKDPTKYQYFDNGQSVRVTFTGTQTTLTVWSGADYPQTWQQTDLDAAVAAPAQSDGSAGCSRAGCATA